MERCGERVTKNWEFIRRILGTTCWWQKLYTSLRNDSWWTVGEFFLSSCQIALFAGPSRGHWPWFYYLGCSVTMSILPAVARCILLLVFETIFRNALQFIYQFYKRKLCLKNNIQKSVITTTDNRCQCHKIGEVKSQSCACQTFNVTWLKLFITSLLEGF